MSLRQLGYAAYLAHGHLDDAEDNLGRAICLTAERLAGKAVMATERSLPPELLDHLAKLSRRFGPLDVLLQAGLTGGFAVRCYTRHRMS